jgi:hypothetical protein
LKKTLHLGDLSLLGIDSWKIPFRLPAVGKVGGEIMLRLCIQNSVWILVQAVEGERPPCCTIDSAGVLIY